MSSPVNYTAHDIARYHRGEMTAAEMHLLEKAALNDPMLADALEGYLHTTDAEVDLQLLQNRLQQRLAQKSKSKIFSLNNPWLKVAALFVLVAGSGLLVLNTFMSQDSEIAKSSEASSGRQHSQPANDSASGLESFTTSLPTDSLQRNEEIVATQTRKAGPPASPAGAVSDTSRVISTDAQAGTAATSSEEELSDKNTTSDIVTLRSAEAVNTNRDVPDTGKHTGTDLSTEKGKSSDITANRRAQSAAPATVTAAPDGGWPAFEKYIADNKKTIPEINTGKETKREVELQFEIDKSGNPVRIKTVRSSCAKCNEEAIRLLREGPKWKPENSKGKVRILW